MILRCALLLQAACLFSFAADPLPLRPPATPLIAHDPYFSIWSMSDRLTDQWTKHWTGTDQQLAGYIRIDGKSFRFMGPEMRGITAPAMDQKSREVTPTRTVYTFNAAGLDLTLTFFTPAMPSNLDVLSRPVTYIGFNAKSSDGQSHATTIYFDASSQLAINTGDQKVTASRYRLDGLDVIRVGTVDQAMLTKSGDNMRIDWGYAYVAVPAAAGNNTTIAGVPARATFLKGEKLATADDMETSSGRNRDQMLLTATFDVGKVASTPVERHLLLAYDDHYSIQYMQRNLRPYWRRNGMTAAELLQTAEKDYTTLLASARRFDQDLTDKLTRAGGAEYAAVSTLAFRQTLAAHKLVADLDGSPMYFSKENFSNGCIDTVDVTYPSAPFFLYFNPALLTGQLKPIYEYASLPRWRFPFAPHDLGTYPLANGQVYGGGERTEENQMPVEESGNMLILTAALAKVTNNAQLAQQYWPQLAKWAAYLREKGLNPENQLSTDDFAGHLAHNTNLSLKAILALRSYAYLAEMTGKRDVAAEYTNVAKDMASTWKTMALDGDHYKLAFDKPGTWSQKYNLVWDKLLGFNLFAPDIARTEMAFYKAHQNEFGLPLDNREKYTKLDWVVWTATLADNRADFEALVKPLYQFANQSPSRVPLTDWFGTVDGKQRGFQARSVVGGVFIKMLDPAVRDQRQ